MTLSLLLDMNLSPDWVDTLRLAGYSAQHWSEVGTATASDREILEFALQNHRVVITQDLDFTILLALTRAVGPSVILIRSRNAKPNRYGSTLIHVIQSCLQELMSGSLIVVDDVQHRVRVLPI